MCDSMNHTRFPKEDHTPDWVCRDKHGNKDDPVEDTVGAHPVSYSVGNGGKAAEVWHRPHSLVGEKVKSSLSKRLGHEGEKGA